MAWYCASPSSANLSMPASSFWIAASMLTRVQHDVGHAPLRPGDASLVAKVAVSPPDVLQVGERRLDVVVPDEGHVTEVEDRVGDAGLVADGLGELDLLFVVDPGLLLISLPVGDVAGRRHRPHPLDRPPLAVGHRERSLGEDLAFREVAAALPEPPKRVDESLGEARIA